MRLDSRRQEPESVKRKRSKEGDFAGRERELILSLSKVYRETWSRGDDRGVS